MIKAIVYDLDGMVFKEPRYYTQEMEIKFGISLKDSLFSKDPRYKECKKGQITLDEFLAPYYKKWRQYPQFKLSLAGVKKDWFNFTKANLEMIRLAAKLKKRGLINLIMTNNSRERINYLTKKYNLDKTFEIIGSYDLGVLKPDPVFYEVLKKRYGLKLTEVLYFDDKKENVAGLKRLGFQAVVYQDFSRFCQELEKLGIKLDLLV